MSKKRPWKLWTPKFIEELNTVGGVAGAGGTLISVAGFTIFAGTVGVVVGGVGAIIGVGSVIYAGYKAIPRKYLKADDHVGQNLNLNDLLNIYPPIKKLAIIGPSNVGKTTLKEQLSFSARTKQRTQTLTAQVVSIPHSPPKYLAIMDGAGEKLHHQFELARHCEFLYIVLDHNDSDNEIRVSAERINENTHFLSQVRTMLSDENVARKERIEILMNKHDLWGRGSASQQAKLNAQSGAELAIWRASNLAQSVVMHPHSNERADDINRVMERLKNSF